MTYRIQRSIKSGAIVFALSGEMDIDHSKRLRELLSEEDGRIILDLKDVTLVDRTAVDFLARVETTGVQIVNCPDYVRTWIAAERRHTPGS